MPRALIVVDVQPDFCEGGALPVQGGDAVAVRIAEHLGASSYDLVLATQDWHVAPEGHFADEPDFRDTWPPHCLAESDGAALHPALRPLGLTTYRKGAYAAAYSGFEADGLAETLRQAGVDDVVVCGLATDHCVRMTALDAVRLGYPTTVLTDLCAGVAAETTAQALSQLRAAGVQLD